LLLLLTESHIKRILLLLKRLDWHLSRLLTVKAEKLVLCCRLSSRLLGCIAKHAIEIKLLLLGWLSKIKQILLIRIQGRLLLSLICIGAENIEVICRLRLPTINRAEIRFRDEIHQVHLLIGLDLLVGLLAICI
jgi:hypothetical protein